MKKLHEVVKERHERQKELNLKTKTFKEEESRLDSEIEELLRLENVAQEGLDIAKIQIAEDILDVRGNIYGKTDWGSGVPTIAELAIVDIAEDCEFMKSKYFGNKQYEGYYQRCNSEYGYGPRHGSIIDRIGLKNPKTKLTDDEKDACIYYIKNYNKIK